MFVFVKGKGGPRVFNPIKDKLNKYKNGPVGKNGIRLKDGSIKATEKRTCGDYGMRSNVWKLNTAGQENFGKRLPHPAMFPNQLVCDHILSWSNEGDLVFDPFMGSGTVGAVCKRLNRRFMGFEINPDYFQIAKDRIDNS
jgi:site-specific DNA-methyltransferase (adenine-specific)